jgi:hypothetical protein
MEVDRPAPAEGGKGASVGTEGLKGKGMVGEGVRLDEEALIAIERRQGESGLHCRCTVEHF